ncbi:MAG: hypothetical protein HZA88_08350 [Verrucomicrobia bacterium]|nr:hypothetical protein [Verrucomicrobiota bacterium]
MICRGFYMVKTWMFIIGMAATAAFAQPPPQPQQSQQPEVSQPAFAAEWRVTAFIRQGKQEEASLERTGTMARFVREGDHLPGGIIVLDVKYDERQVVLGKGKETAIIQQETTMAPPPASQTAVQKQAVAVKKGKVEKATAMRDENGRWVVAFPNGRNLDMQSYVDRHGGVAGAMQHVQELMARETDPERLEYRKQQLQALQQISATGNPPAPAESSYPARNRTRSVVF